MNAPLYTRRTTFAVEVVRKEGQVIRNLSKRTRSISAIVNDAVRAVVGEDQADLEAFDDRVEEPVMSYEKLRRKLKTRRQP